MVRWGRCGGECRPAWVGWRDVTTSASDPRLARRRRAAQRARSDPARGDAEHRPGRDRLDDPGDGRAVGGLRPRRLHVVPVAVLDLPAGAGDLGAAVRQARRPLRPQAPDAVRGRAVRARLAAVRRRLGDDRADRLPAGAGARRGRDRADRDDDPRRHLLAAGARHRAGVPRQRLGDGRPDRPHAGRRLLRLDRLAVDLLRQPPARGGGDVGDVATVRGERRASQAPHRLPRVDPARPRWHPAPAGAARGRRPVGVGLRCQHRPVRRPRWRC